MVPSQGLLHPLSLVGGRPGGPPASFAAAEGRVPLAVRGLRVELGGVLAVDGLDLVVPAGAVVGLVGPNGCGKTTTLRAVVGLVEASGGTVLVDGARGGTVAARARAGWAPDEPTGLDELSVDEFLALVRALWRAPDGFDGRADVLVDAFGLQDRRAVQLGSLSHGQRRVTAIVAAVALDRRLLLVDEATAALDPEAVAVLREVVRTCAARGRGVLLATQDLHFAESTCDRVTLLSAGRRVGEGTPDELRSRFRASTLQDAFLRAVGAGGRIEEVRRALAAL